MRYISLWVTGKETTCNIITIMGFDKNDGTPIVEPAKKTTKVNIVMVLAVAVFFLIGGIAIAWMHAFRG